MIISTLRPLFVSSLIRQTINGCRRINTKHQQYIKKRSMDVVSLGKLMTMKLETAIFERIYTPEMKFIEELFKKNGYEIRIAGGAVRDLLMGIEPHDIDFASTATPEQMKTMFTQEEIRMINAGGERHGTITARINDKENFEVTTLRIDVVTDGRRAELDSGGEFKVEFTTDWQLDAGRRDLTINAMFLTFDGIVHDYFNGIEHLKQRKVQFVGDAATRIQEDYLRILRYFRFYGRIAADDKQHDAKTLEAIRQNAGGLEIISGERLSTEFVKIVNGNLCCSLVCTMIELGITPLLGFPQNPNVEEFEAVCKIGNQLHHMTKIAALLRNEDEAMYLHARLKLSNSEKNLLLFIIQNRNELKNEAVDRLKCCQAWQFKRSLKGITPNEVYEFTKELIKYTGDEVLLQKFNEWEVPKFPITGFKLLAAGVPKGRKTGLVMQELREIWMESDFSLSEDELLKMIKDILPKMSPTNAKMAPNRSVC